MADFKFKIGNTNREVVNAFRNIVADKLQMSQSNGWSFRLVYYYLLRYRAKLIREKALSNKDLSQWNYQTIDCIPLMEVDMSECPCEPKSGCSWLRTEYTIPKPLHKLKSVTSKDGQVTYTFVEWERLKYKLMSRIPAQSKYAYYTIKTRNDGTHLYLYNDIFKKHLTVSGIFENPLEVQFFPDCNGVTKPCIFPDQQEFILDPDIFPAMYSLAFDQIARAKQLGIDALNDDLDNITTTQLNVK